MIESESQTIKILELNGNFNGIKYDIEYSKVLYIQACLKKQAFHYVYDVLVLLIRLYIKCRLDYLFTH
jgi:hypothetical protein